jgi:hypothetical protein
MMLLLAPLVLAATITLKVDPKVSARFDPERAIGATVDAHDKGENGEIFTPKNIAAILSAGFKPLSYRLATELGGEAWHWNPRGTWSDAAHTKGYWTSDDDSPSPIEESYGYRLPRRGNTRDQARNNDWSRIDDGDLSTFWKSNPYLDPRPQWLLIDLGTPHRPDAIRIVWREPFAIDYDVQVWSGDDPILNPEEGDWVTLRGGAIRGAHGGDVRHAVEPAPFAVRWVRVLMMNSSHTSLPHPDRSASKDMRSPHPAFGHLLPPGEGTDEPHPGSRTSGRITYRELQEVLPGEDSDEPHPRSRTSGRITYRELQELLPGEDSDDPHPRSRTSGRITYRELQELLPGEDSEKPHPRSRTSGPSPSGEGGRRPDEGRAMLPLDSTSPLTREIAHDDARDRAGFAVAEVYVEEDGREIVRHAKSHDAQSIVWVSSTDPWHRAIDIDQSVEQPGLDQIFETGLTRGLPMLTPVALLYGTPEDSAAEIRYLRKRRRNVQMIEMGEEPDGQAVSPEDYAALYMLWAAALHRVDSSLILGGPALQSTRDRIAFWREAAAGRGVTSDSAKVGNATGDSSTAWMSRFLDALRDRQRLEDFGFFSFEWYPFDDVCASSHPQLVEAPAILARVMKRWREEGVPQSIPWLATEYGWSSYAAEAGVDLPGALFNAEFVADFLASGGAAAYFYGIEPERLIPEPCGAWGNLTLFLADDERQIRARVPAYWSARLLANVWLAPRGMHQLHNVIGTSKLLRAWSVRRPDGTWSMLIINKDDQRSMRVRIDGARNAQQYSQRNYTWKANGANGRAVKSAPPHALHVKDELELPPYSLTVVSGRLSVVGRPVPPRTDN